MAIRTNQQPRTFDGKVALPITQIAARFGVSRPMIYEWAHLGFIRLYEYVYARQYYVSVEEADSVAERLINGTLVRPEGSLWIVPPSLRTAVFERDGQKCRYCGKDVVGREANTDHILPYLRGGKHTMENLVTACQKCNKGKGNHTPEEAGMALLPIPEEETKNG